MSADRRAECGCIGWLCGLCGKQCWTCREGGADEYPDLCDDCWDYVIGPDSQLSEDRDCDAQLVAEMKRIMRRLAAQEAA